LLPGLNGDALLKAVAPALKKMLEPVVLDTRKSVLNAIAGPAPASFITRVQATFDMTAEEIHGIWLHAIESAAELL
jgi:hypothetical protein